MQLIQEWWNDEQYKEQTVLHVIPELQSKGHFLKLIHFNTLRRGTRNAGHRFSDECTYFGK